MKAQAESQMTSRERLARGLTYSAVGPLDVTRGVVGLGVHSAQTTASELRRRYRQGQLARDTRPSQRSSKRPLVIAGVVVAILAGGAAAFSIVRRSSRPEPSPRPPSVDVQPRP